MLLLILLLPLLFCFYRNFNFKKHENIYFVVAAVDNYSLDKEKFQELIIVSKFISLKMFITDGCDKLDVLIFTLSRNQFRNVISCRKSLFIEGCSKRYEYKEYL